MRACCLSALNLVDRNAPKPRDLDACGIISVLLQFFSWWLRLEKIQFSEGKGLQRLFSCTLFSWLRAHAQTIAGEAGIFPNGFWPRDWC